MVKKARMSYLSIVLCIAATPGNKRSLERACKASLQVKIFEQRWASISSSFFRLQPHKHHFNIACVSRLTIMIILNLKLDFKKLAFMIRC